MPRATAWRSRARARIRRLARAGSRGKNCRDVLSATKGTGASGLPAREDVVRVLELAYDTTFPEAIRASITTPIFAYIALARMGKIDDEEAKQN